MSETSGFDGFGWFLYNFAGRYAVGKKILDIGCGIGKGAVILSKHTSEAVIGIDYSEKAITQASKQARSFLNYSIFCILKKWENDLI